MNILGWRGSGDTSTEPVTDLHPLPTQDMVQRPNFAGAPYFADQLWRMAESGRIYVASDADQDDVVTGQTSFANTTPTFLLRVPAGVTVVPLFLNLMQTGTIAGGAVGIDVYIEMDASDRYSSGGTPELVVFNANRTNRPLAKSTVFSGATAKAGYGVRLWGGKIVADVDGVTGQTSAAPFWKPEAPYWLEGPASLLIYTWAVTTGPTWFWSLGFMEFATGTGR